MDKKVTFYLREDLHAKLIEWQHKYYLLTGYKATRTQILNELVATLTDAKEDVVHNLRIDSLKN